MREMPVPETKKQLLQKPSQIHFRHWADDFALPRWRLHRTILRAEAPQFERRRRKRRCHVPRLNWISDSPSCRASQQLFWQIEQRKAFLKTSELNRSSILLPWRMKETVKSPLQQKSTLFYSSTFNVYEVSKIWQLGLCLLFLIGLWSGMNTLAVSFLIWAFAYLWAHEN